jgi:hypothetical protein
MAARPPGASRRRSPESRWAGAGQNLGELASMPSTSGPFTGSSKTPAAGSPSSAAAMPSRCAFPRENLPAGRPATERSPIASPPGRNCQDLWIKIFG